MKRNFCNFEGRSDRRGLACGLAILLAGAAWPHPARATTAYLPVVGPVPLRFELATAESRPLAWKALRLTLWPPENAVAAAAKASALTNSGTATAAGPSSAGTATNALSQVSRPATGLDEKTNGAALPEPEIFTDQAGDASDPVSAKILTEYFIPGAGGKKGGGTLLILPGQVGFTPPVPKVGTENRATYKSQ